MVIALLIVHGLIGVALLGALTHQAVAVLRHETARTSSFIDRYSRVAQSTFTHAIIMLYVASVIVGAVIYPSYRLDVRIPFEEMRLGWAIGIFELKEHFGGIGLGVLPMYAYAWRAEGLDTYRATRTSLTLLLALIVWWNFLVGHILNNIRGLG
jgi:hypothetical protein